jgi:CheY-like chemotaxis protein
LNREIGEADVQTTGRGQTEWADRRARRVVVVDGNPDVLDLLETALDGGQYELLFAESGHHAYSMIRREQPDLIVLSMRIDSMDSFRLLSMLKLDPDTKAIPVVTYAEELDDHEEPAADDLDDDIEYGSPPMRLH